MVMFMESFFFVGFRVIEDERNLFFIFEVVFSFSDKRSLIGSYCCLEMWFVIFEVL